MSNLDRPEISVIIPAFNEEVRIIPTLEKVVTYLADELPSWEVVVVDDGSTDATASLVDDWADSHSGVRLISVPHEGKGWAVKRGMLAATGKYRFMCDADLATPIEWLSKFLSSLAEGYDIVIGSREATGARRIDEPLLRHIMGRIYNRSVKLLAVGGYQDTQCGFKLFRGEVADELFSLQRTRTWGFDVELLYLARKRHLKVLELAVDWYYQEESKVRHGVDSFLMLRDAAAVRWRNLRGKYQEIVDFHAEEDVASDEINSFHKRQQKGTTKRKVHDKETKSLTIVVPTYNEADNLHELVHRIFSLGIPNTRLIIVDDNSPDGTAKVAKELSKEFNGRLEVIERDSKLGLGTAYIDGFTRALESEADFVVQMDADLSHPPEYLPSFIAALDDADVVVGSRYVSGGSVDPNWSVNRRFLSYFANLGIRTVAGLKVKDATSGFKAFRGCALKPLDLTQFQCKGFGFQAEVAHACQKRGYKVVELPITFVDRNLGQSKMSFHIAFEALWRVLPLRWRRYNY